MKDAIIVDIDGTAALGIGEHRQPYDYSLVGKDKPNTAVFINIFSFWSLFPDGEVIFLSGRENVVFPGKSERKDKCYRVGKFQGQEYPDCKTLTKAWLEHYLQHFDDIIKKDILIEVIDWNNNKTYLNFQIEGILSNTKEKPIDGIEIVPDQEYKIKKNNMEIEFRKNSFFNKVALNIESIKKLPTPGNPSILSTIKLVVNIPAKEKDVRVIIGIKAFFNICLTFIL